MPFKFNPFTGNLGVVSDDSASGIVTQRGTFNANVTIPISSNYTLIINLDGSDYQSGHLMLYIPNNISYSPNRRRSSFVMFTTDINRAIARSSGDSNDDFWTKGYHSEDSNRLSGNFFGATAIPLRIRSCVIDGNKIKLRFRNPDLTNEAVLICKGEFQVFT